MKVSYRHAKAESLAAVVLVFVLLLGGGVFAYATRIQGSQAENAAPLPDDGAQSSQEYYLHLVAVSPPPTVNIPDYRIGQGIVRILVAGTSIQVAGEVQGNNPSTRYNVVMKIDSKSKSVANFTTNGEGSGQFEVTMGLDPGVKVVGLLVFDTSTFPAPLLVMVSDPASITITVSQNTTSQTTTSSRSSESTSSYYSTTRSSYPSDFSFRLVAVQVPVATPAGYVIGQGEAYLHVGPNEIGVNVGLNHANPNTDYGILLVVDDARAGSAANNLRTVGEIRTEANGSGKLQTQIQLDSGTYLLGFQVYDKSSFSSPLLVMISDPTAVVASVPPSGTSTTITTETTRSTTTTTSQQRGILAYKLISLPAWLLTPQPVNYSFSHGEAAIAIDGTNLHVLVYFQGISNTQFTVVLTVNDGNVTVGAVNTDSGGNGRLETDTSLPAGQYHLGFLVFVSTEVRSDNLVGVSVPRTLPALLYSYSRSTTTTTTTTTTETERQHSTERHEKIQILNFTLVPAPGVPVPSTGYSYGGGIVYVGEVRPGVLGVKAEIHNANPNTRYSLVLSVNGTNHIVADFQTNANGEGHVRSGEALKVSVGTFLIGVSVLDTSTFGSPTMVLTGSPATQTLVVPYASNSTTTTQTRTTESTGPPHEHELHFSLVPVAVQNAPANYRSGQGEGVIRVHGQTVGFDVEFYRANPNTQYTLAATINGTTEVLGNTVTRNDGWANVIAEIQLNPAVYKVQLVIIDPRSFSDPNTVVMVSNPQTMFIRVEAAPAESQSGSQASGGSLTTITGGADQENQIHQAVQGKLIPAVIVLTSTGATASLIDPRFSVSVGKAHGSGFIISISATNVTGPRTLLINLTGSSAFDITSHSLNVTVDGGPIIAASSVTQVLNPLPTDPARYIIVVTSSGTQLLISIPHFSLHTIQVLPILLAQVQNLLEVSGQVVLLAGLIIGAIFAAAYRGRRKVYSVFL